MDSHQFRSNSFKCSNWEQKKKEIKSRKNQRQNKNLKQIMANELQQKSEFNCSFFNKSYNFKDISIEAPPPFCPPKKYCDITGYETKYKDKDTQLLYYDKFVYSYIKTLTNPIIEQYLSLRKINLPN